MKRIVTRMVNQIVPTNRVDDVDDDVDDDDEEVVMVNLVM